MNQDSSSNDCLDRSERFDKARYHIHRDMLTAVSHDLKTPLASIIGSLEIYRRMNDRLSPEKKVLLIATALQEGYRLDAFIANILDMARLENGLVHPHLEPCDLGQILKDCLTRLEQRVVGTDVKLRAASGPITVLTDPTLLCRAVSLLLDNALQHAGPSAISVEYGCEGPGRAFIRVRDRGRGVPEDQREAIFSKYVRLGGQYAHNPGTGLGLAICREILHLLSGSVRVENHPDGGAMFILSLPANKKGTL